MTDQERNIITAVWNDTNLRTKLEGDPYSLTQDELMALRNNDILNNKLEQLLRDVLTNKVLMHVRN